MTLIKRYAIEPAALRHWQDFRYVMEKMSFSNGRIMVALPKKWMRELLDHLDVGDIECARFVEKLHRYKEDRIISAKGIAYNQSIRWIDNAQRSQCLKLVDEILIAQETKTADPTLPYLTPSEIDEDFFSSRRELRCLNTPETLVNLASILLDVSPYAIFVDPYFYVGRKSCLSVLAEFVRHTQENENFSTITFFTSSETIPKGEEAGVRIFLEKEVASFLTKDINVCFCFIDKSEINSGFHARYLLTSRGGLRYDKGFASQNPPEIVDISLLDQGMHKYLVEQYCPENPKIPVKAKWMFEFSASK